MSLIKCPECGHAISEDALSCPNCGHPTSINSSEVTAGDTSNIRKPGKAYRDTAYAKENYNDSDKYTYKSHKSGGVHISTSPLKKKKKVVLGFLFKLIVVLIILSLIGTGAYYVYKYYNDVDKINSTETTENIKPDSGNDSKSQNEKKDENKNTDETEQNNNSNDSESNKSNKSNKEILHDPAPDGGTEDNGAEGGQDITDEIP